MDNKENTEGSSRSGLLLMLACCTIWGLQPLYWRLCAGMDTIFLMACRAVFGSALLLLLLKLMGKLPMLWAAMGDKEIMKREVPAAVFLFGDWFVYLWAVQNGRVMECSLGYYIMPLVVFVFGACIFKERFTKRHILVLLIVVAGIIISGGSFGSFPAVAVSLSLMFAIYAAIKKSLTMDYEISTTLEIILLTPLAVLASVLYGDPSTAALNVTNLLLLIGAGLVTAGPMLLYALSVKKLPLMTVGILGYLSPTLAIVCSLILGESLTPRKLLSFAVIWLGIAVYMLSEKRQTAASVK